ncbi:MAG: AtzE family amidohydrolase [Verrucomicrobiota bacterium]
MVEFEKMDALAIAEAVRNGSLTARVVTEAALARIEALDRKVNAFTTVTKESALAEADAVDALIAQGADPGPLAGVPFAVKNLFDLEGVTTVAGSKIHQDAPPAESDAISVRKLKKAGAVSLGALNMDEYAYGFTTENSHYGPTHNPHHLDHVAGGSSGGSAAAVAAGMVPLTLGTDTNGSIRVPSAFCGIFGIQATYGRFSRAGALLFAESFDRIGPFARSVRDLAISVDLLQGPDPEDKVCISEPLEPVLPELEEGIDGFRIAKAGGYFAEKGLPEVFAGLSKVTEALEVSEEVEIPYAASGRAAAYIITGTEGGNFHMNSLRTRPQDFDPVVRDRFLAGPLIPGAWYVKAQKFRSIYRKAVLKLFETYDVILAPTTPTLAIKIGQETMVLDGIEMASRPNIGLYTQPLSFIGLPIISVPIHLPGQLPVGVMLIGAPHSEAKLLRLARYLEKAGVVKAPTANVA